MSRRVVRMGRPTGPREASAEFEAWLQGDNGGPLRHPTQRIHDAQMNMLRKGLADSGLQPASEPNRDFFVGRNPT